MLIFSIIETKFNITYFIVIIAYFAKKPRYVYIKAVKTIFYYFKRLLNKDIIYKRQDKLLVKRYLDFN